MKDIFTTAEASRICGLSQQTIIRLFDSGNLEGFLVPGSRFRRIPRDSLIKFMREHSIPLARLDGPKKKILVADYEPEIVRMLKDVLERDGRFEVIGASSGQDAIRLAEQSRPDLVVVACLLSDGNAVSACKSFRTSPTLRDIPIIVEGAGFINEAFSQQLVDLKVDACVWTPFRFDEMVAKIAELLDI